MVREEDRYVQEEKDVEDVDIQEEDEVEDMDIQEEDKVGDARSEYQALFSPPFFSISALDSWWFLLTYNTNTKEHMG